MTYEQAEDILSKSHDKYFDYLKGRVMKIDLSGEMMDTWLYDRDNGQGSVITSGTIYIKLYKNI
jgi:hypothetical protein